jgi:dolichol-phosphate mannosyltransferase
MAVVEMTAPARRDRERSTVPDVTVIVPTYCEADNLPELTMRVFAALSQGNLLCEMIVVDDDSPDATSSVCRDLSAQYPLQLIIRKDERGLSSAVIHGMNVARGAALIVMDADLSHPPEQIPALMESLKSHQFAIGSRYMNGGETEDRWGLTRRWLSRSATWLARPLTSVSDPMSGFFAISRESYCGVADKLTPVGYKIGLELIVKLGCRAVGEVPIFFEQRKRGASKLTLREELRYLRHLTRLYGYRMRQTFAKKAR